MKSLLMDVKVGDSVSIDGGKIIVTVEEKSGQRARLRFTHVDSSIERRATKRDTPDRRAVPR